MTESRSLGLTYTIRPDGTKSVTISDEARAFVVSFVQDIAKKPVDAIAAVVQEGHDALIAALAGVSGAQARHKPSPDDWCILELMDHIVTTQQIVVNLSRNLGEGHLPPGIGAEWEDESRQDGVTRVHFATIDDARAASDAAHADLLKLIADLDAVNLDTTFRHFLFGAFNAREWTVFQRIHDEDHTPQIAAIKASPRYPAA